METAKSFRDLIVWQKAHRHVLAVYRHTKTFPDEERYGLSSQIRRAAVSVAANIVEGFRKSSIPEKLRYLNIAEGSLEECRYYVLLSADLQYGIDSELQPLQEEVSKLLSGYSSALRRKTSAR